MDLRHNQITIQELLADPRAREVLASLDGNTTP